MKNSKLTVTFLGCSKDPIEIAFAAIKIKDDSDSPANLWKQIQDGDTSEEKMRSCLRENGVKVNTTPIHNVQFVFWVSQLSYTSAAYLNQSMADTGTPVFTDPSPDVTQLPGDLIIPPTINENPALLTQWNATHRKLVELYQLCGEFGVGDKDRQRLLPLGVPVQELYSMSFHTLQTLLDRFMCDQEDWELHRLSRQIYAIMEQEFPSLSKRIGAHCGENRGVYCKMERNRYETCRWRVHRPHYSDISTFWENTPLASDFEAKRP